MKKFYSIIGIFVLMFSYTLVFSQGSTTSALIGKVTDNTGSSLPGATVLLVEINSGTPYGTITDDKGFYRLANVNPGGPYKLTISYVGFEPSINEDIYLSLGQTLKSDVSLSESATTLADVEVIGQRNDIFDGNRTGSETNISETDIKRMPSVGRNLSDLARLTPEATVNSNGGISIAGQNNRYNAIFINGAVNNDVFGLAASGTNGGQIGLSPFSMDIIDQINVNVAPYDIRLGGFTGAGINAVTKKGNNEFTGTAYFYFRNQSLSGKTPYALVENLPDPDASREKLADFSSSIYGFSLGGPVIKDKVFFFANAEIQKDENPRPYSYDQYNGSYTSEEIQSLSNYVQSTYGYDPGTFLSSTNTLDALKLFGRLDWNINKQNKLTLSYQYTGGKAIQPGSSSNSSIYFSNSGQDFTSNTNVVTAELKSNISNRFSNSLLVGLTFVRDNRDPMGDNFPYVRIRDGSSNVYFGSEQYSTANILNQNIITVTDNFEIYSGTNTFTVGMNIEYYDFYNLFIRQNFGSYQFSDLATFLGSDPIAYQYDRTYSLLDDVTGDGSIAAADFNVVQVGAYGQWAKQWSDNFKTTVGLRFDIPMFTSDPPVNQQFNDSIIPILESYGYDLKGAETGKMPAPSLLLSPRIGFNWDVKGDLRTQLRGGVGIFTSRLPFVWPGGSFTNNGVTLGGMRTYDVAFNSVWDDQPSLPAGRPSGEVDIFAKDFKYPQVFRASLALDQKLPGGIIGTIEGTYTKTINNVLYTNMAYIQDGNLPATTGDTRATYSKIDLSSVNGGYTDIVFGDNTNKGSAYNITVRLQKNNFYGLSVMLAYSYGNAKSMNDGTSSQNVSQLKVPNINGMNNLDLTTSNYAMGSKYNAFLNYKIEYAKHLSTTIGLYFNGQYAQRYSYGVNDLSGSVYLGLDSQDLSLFYIPTSDEDIRLVDIPDGATAAQQWADLNSFIEGDDYLSQHRGEYAERNSNASPFQNIIDLHISQDFYVTTKGGKRNTLQVTFDVFNFTNMLSKNWGKQYYVSGYYNNYSLINLVGFAEDGTPEYQFTAPKGDVWSIDDAGLNSSRWQAQIGIRYIFN